MNEATINERSLILERYQEYLDFFPPFSVGFGFGYYPLQTNPNE